MYSTPSVEDTIRHKLQTAFNPSELKVADTSGEYRSTKWADRRRVWIFLLDRHRQLGFQWCLYGEEAEDGKSSYQRGSQRHARHDGGFQVVNTIPKADRRR